MDGSAAACGIRSAVRTLYVASTSYRTKATHHQQDERERERETRGRNERECVSLRVC
jgi:hypothetical protein